MNHIVNRPPNLCEGILLFVFGFVIFKVTFDLVYFQLTHSKFLQKFHRTLCNGSSKVTSDEKSPILDEKSLFELSNWVVSTIQV